VTRAKPSAAEVLDSDDGPCILVRATDLEEAIRIAHEEAAADDLVVAYPEDARLGWFRTIPCVPRATGGHVVQDADCPGGLRCHYISSAPGRGAFRGALIDLNYAGEYDDDDPVKAPYLRAVAEMEARALPGEDGSDV
jgi:hypothetical protein